GAFGVEWSPIDRGRVRHPAKHRTPATDLLRTTPRRTRAGKGEGLMRIAYVCADRGVPVFGRKGCSVHVQELVRALGASGARVELFTPRGEGMPAPGFDDVKLHRLPFTQEEVRAFREKLALAANEDLRAALQRHGPFDLV